MMKPICKIIALTTVVLNAARLCVAHDVGPVVGAMDTNPVTPMRIEAEAKGAVKAPALEAGHPVSGQGYWKFTAATNLVPVPEGALTHLKGAHGTIIVDSERDTVYWGLQGVGWIGFSNKLASSWIVPGDPMFSHGNLHGADLIHRRGKLPLVAVADNADGQVYLSDTTFQNAQKLDWPQTAPYKNKQEFHPTDVAFVDAKNIFVTDGYGAAYLMSAGTEPFAYSGTFLGGKDVSKTPHGVTYRASDRSLIVSARPEGQIKRWLINKQKWAETLGLPPGSTVCDVDLWGDYALAPCLDGPDKKPGPIYILNLKKKTIVSIIRPKEDLQFAEALHIHDAAWYVTGKGAKQEVYIVFTNWNPGGVGALKLVSAAD
jgi:hypothetical protein